MSRKGIHIERLTKLNEERVELVKKTEEKLLALQKELEALSFKDGLTNIANRRRFNVSLEL